MKGDNFKFPVADGTVKISGGDLRLKPSKLIRERPDQGEEKQILQGKSDGFSSPTPIQDDSTLDDAEAKYGLLREISFVAITWNPESNCTCRKKNHLIFR